VGMCCKWCGREAVRREEAIRDNARNLEWYRRGFMTPLSPFGDRGVF